MPAGLFMIVFIASLAGATVWNHFRIHGSFGWTFVVIAVFLSLNLLICYWELVLLFCAKKVFAESEVLYRDSINDKPKPMADFMRARVGLRDVFTPSFWTQPWSAYSLFDGSYCDKRTFGYTVDVSNGLSTLIPSIIVHLGLTWQFCDARVLGILALAMFYQMAYGTVVYWLSFGITGRYKLLTFRENLLYIAGCNVPWFLLGSIGIYAAIRMILDNSYAVLG